MAYTRNQPVASDLLSASQPILRDNTNAADDSFGVDHYKFSDTSPNNGFHNQVTTPLIVGSAHPATTTNPIFYCMNDAGNIGNLQYSRGPNNAAPTPLTELHSPFGVPLVLLPGQTTNVLDMTGIFVLMGTLYMVNYSTSAGSNVISTSNFIWNSLVPGFKFDTSSSASSNPLVATSSGSILQIRNADISLTLTAVFWTLNFHRINT